MSEGGRTARTFWADASRDEALDAYRTLADTIDDGLCQLDVDGRFVAVNDVLVERLGYARDDLLGEPLSMLVVDDAAERVSRLIRERHANPDDEAATLDVEARRASGEQIPVELRLNALSDAGEVTGFVGVVRVRQREHPEPEPELSEIMNRISDGFFAVDENWEFTHINEPAHDLINPDGGELVGKNVWEEFPAATERKFKEYYERAMREQVTVSFEEYYPDPLNAWFEVNAYPSETGLSVYFQDVTERKEREQRFEQYETIIETMNDGIYVKDEDGRFTMVNEAYAEMTGYSQEELVGAHASLVVDESTITESRQRFETPDGHDATMEAAIETADGDSVPAEATFATVETDGERLEVGVVRDITERKEYERRIEESERRYRTLVENFPNGAVGLFDENLAYTAIGGELIEGLDLAPEDRIGKSISDIHPEEFAAQLEPHFRTALDGETSNFEVEFQGKHLDVTVLPVGEWDGKMQGMLLVRDVTEQREMEQELRESEARFRMLAENLEEIVWMADPEGEEILYLNPAYEDIWGRDREELYAESESFLAYVHPNDRERITEAFAALPEEEFEEEFRIVRPDGEIRWIRAQGKQVHDSSVDLVRIVGIGQDVTNRKEREHELERALDLLERTEEVADVGGWEIDTETMDVFWSDNIFDVLQVEDDEEPPLEEALDMYHDDDRPLVEDAIEEALESGEPFDVEARIYTTNGDIRWLRLQGVPELEDGEVVSLRGAAQNITERKERERALEESERRYRTLAEHFPNGAVGVYDSDLEYTLAAGEHLGGLLPSADELEGSRMPDIFPEHTVADLEPIFRAAVEDGETGSTMTEFGGRHWQVWATPLRNADGAITAGLSFAQDVTEQVERERTLEVRAHQQAVVAELGKYALEVDNLDELMKVASQRVADVLDNDYCKVLDLDDEERHLLLRQGVGWRDGIVGSATVDADENSQAGYTLLSQEPVVVEDLETETRFQGPELLTSHDVTSGISTIIGSVDEPWGILGTHDTASRTFSEEDVAFVQTVANILAESIERDRYNAELERTVRELEESNERLEQFAYAASHDLQEPLRMVSSYLSLIKRRYEDVLDEDGLEFIEYAVDGAERMRKMIDALLAYSRVETRGDPFEPVDLQETMEAVLSDYQVRIEETDATISTTDLPTVYGDESQLRQVFGNLLSNAIEYSGDEPPTVRVFAEREGDRWIVGVEDEGIGIEPEHADRVFEVFQRLHTQEEYGGTGIGLALAERIVERHGGEIWVESEPGEGSTFYCSLPVVQETNDRSP